MGHSLGGFTAATAAVQDPSKIAALVLIAPALASSALSELSFRLEEAAGVADVSGVSVQQCVATAQQVLQQLEDYADQERKKEAEKQRGASGWLAPVQQVKQQVAAALSAVFRSFLAYVVPPLAMVSG